MPKHSLGWLKWVPRNLKFVRSVLKSCWHLSENYILLINDQETEVFCLVLIIGVVCWGQHGEKQSWVLGSLFTVIFLLDVKPFAHDITCNYPNAGSLQNHFVWFSGNCFSGNVCNCAPFTHLQVLRPLSCHTPMWLVEQCNHLRVPYLCSILYKTSHAGHKLMSPQTTSMPAQTVVFLDFYSYKGYYLHE